MFDRGVEQVRPKLVASGHDHRHVDTKVLLRPADQEPFEIRSVISDQNRTARSVAILQPDSLALDVPENLSPGCDGSATRRRDGSGGASCKSSPRAGQGAEYTTVHKLVAEIVH